MEELKRLLIKQHREYRMRMNYMRGQDGTATKPESDNKEEVNTLLADRRMC